MPQTLAPAAPVQAKMQQESTLPSLLSLPAPGTLIMPLVSAVAANALMVEGSRGAPVPIVVRDLIAAEEAVCKYNAEGQVVLWKAQGKGRPVIQAEWGDEGVPIKITISRQENTSTLQRESGEKQWRFETREGNRVRTSGTYTGTIELSEHGYTTSVDEHTFKILQTDGQLTYRLDKSGYQELRAGRDDKSNELPPAKAGSGALVGIRRENGDYISFNEARTKIDVQIRGEKAVWELTAGVWRDSEGRYEPSRRPPVSETGCYHFREKTADGSLLLTTITPAGEEQSRIYIQDLQTALNLLHTSFEAALSRAAEDKENRCFCSSPPLQERSERFKNNLEAFVRRMELKTHIQRQADPPAADADLNTEKVILSLGNLRELLDGGSTGSREPAYGDAARVHLAEQIAFHLGDTETIDQSPANSCTLAAVQCVMFDHYPQSATRLLADAALQASYVDLDGEAHALPRPAYQLTDQQYQFDLAAARNNSRRSFADALFQTVAAHISRMNGNNFISPSYSMATLSKPGIAIWPQKALFKTLTGEELTVADGLQQLQSPEVQRQLRSGGAPVVLWGEASAGRHSATVRPRFKLIEEAEAEQTEEGADCVAAEFIGHAFDNQWGEGSDGHNWLRAVVSRHTSHRPVQQRRRRRR